MFEGMFRSFAFVLLILLSDLSAAENPVVEIHTNLGVITAELDAKNAPVTVENFLSYVDADGYAGAIFHRVIDEFMIQTGGYYETLSGLDVKEPIYNEAENGLKNITGTLAMAREDVIDSAQRQFFINTNENYFLDHSITSCTREKEAKIAAAFERGLIKPQTCTSYGYAVFGKVTGGMDVVRRIEVLPTTPTQYHQNVPVQTVTIEKIIRTGPKENSE